MNPRYLPIDEPLGRPVVHRFGTDFGNGRLDAMTFQGGAHDGAEVTARYADAPTDAATHEAALHWIDTTLAREHGRLRVDDRGDAVCARYARRLADVAEDLVVLHRGRGDGSIRGLHVRAPSGWRPEDALHASMTSLHAHVPGLLARASGETLTSMMIDRGPYVRFVWGLTTSAALDHHPDRVARPRWERADEGYLRVERQVTMPLGDVSAALFVLRVYVYPFASLSTDVRGRLRHIVTALEPAMRAYKGLPADPHAIDRLLGR
jgi:hypothetical protein